MKKEKKTCCDCLHCKVSAKSAGNSRLYFCSEDQEKENHKESYWLDKNVCDCFSDMTEKPIALLIFQNNRRPLLRSNS
jgi:hypothetical protein